jgi:MoaA/NifB/PqqE/SkfB family radical SAM enzyme
MKEYSTDGKVKHYSLDESDINEQLSDIVGENFRKYRILWDKAQNLEKVSNFPLFLQLDIDQHCNFQCPHCMLSHDDDVKKYFSEKTISSEEYESLLIESSKYNCPSISLQGTNEPLLDKNLEKNLKMAKKYGFIDIMINSNASALTKTRAVSLLNSGLTRLRFSLDAASEAVFNKIRIGGNYKKVIDNINTCIAVKKDLNLKTPLIGVNFCVLNDNQHEQNKFIEIWKDKVDFISIQKFTPPTPEKKWEKFYPKSEPKMSPIEFKCPQPFQRLVLRNRDITPCCAWYSRELSLGRVGETSLYDAWNSKQMEELRTLHKEGRWAENPTCNKCVKSIYRIGEFAEPQESEKNDELVTSIIQFKK